MNTYQKIPPHERVILLAKLYHNMWYSGDRFNMVMDLIDKWDMNPVKEAKFATEILDGTEFQIKNNK
jgi:hypothetical protein